MQLSRFDFREQTNEAAFLRSVRNSPSLGAEHSALVKLGLELARVLDSLGSADRGEVARLSRLYVKVLDCLGLTWKPGRDGAAGRREDRSGEDSGAALLSLESLRARAIAEADGNRLGDGH